MSTLGRTRLRLAADAACFDAPLDTLRRATPQFWRGNDVQFEIAAFFNGALLDVSNLASLTLEIRPLGSNGQAPDPSFAPLMGATITAFDNTTTLDDWNAGAKQHAVVVYTAAQSNVAAGAAWLSIFAITNDSPGRVITLCAGPVRVLEDGAGLATTPMPTADTFYTAAESDARFAAIGAGGEGAPAGNSNPLMDATAAPGTATAYARADHVHPSDTSRAPLASPALTGTPTAPTVGSATDNTTKIATTAFVQAAIAAAGGGGGGAWGSITGTLSSQTDLNTALGLKAALASPALTGTPTAPTVGSATDSTTKIATTAFVQAAIAAAGGGGGGSQWTNVTGGINYSGGKVGVGVSSPAYALDVSGKIRAHSTSGGGDPAGAHQFIADGTEMNTMYVQSTNSDSYSCIFAKDYTGTDTSGDRWALGYGNPTCGGGVTTIFQGKNYLESISYTTGVACPEFFISFDNEADVTFCKRFSIPGNATEIRFYSDFINHPGELISHVLGGSNAGHQNYCQVNAPNGAGNLVTLCAQDGAYSYQAIPAFGAMLLAVGNGGLMIATTAGPLTFYTGGTNNANEWLRIDASGNFIASNSVTSAPAATLANGQYQFCVYDNAGTATLRVRYKNGSGTIKTGDLALS